MKTKLTPEEFKRLKQRLYQSAHALSLSLKDCPHLRKISVECDDGHLLYPHEIIEWIETVRSNCWQMGPDDVQRRMIKKIIEDQPSG